MTESPDPTDLVERLRTEIVNHTGRTRGLLREAADALDRLANELAKARAQQGGDA